MPARSTLARHMGSCTLATGVECDAGRLVRVARK